MNSRRVSEGRRANLDCTRPNKSELHNVFDGRDSPCCDDRDVGVSGVHVVHRANRQRVDGGP